MNQVARPTKSSVSRKRRVLQASLSLAAAGGMLLGASVADACDYCDSGYQGGGCAACDADGCDSGGCDSAGHGLSIPKVSLPKPGKAIFKTLDAVAGGIEKVLGFDKCSSGLSCDSNCDDGCDAALMSDLMMSHQPTYVPHAQTPQTFPIPPAPAPLAPAPVVAPPVYAAPQAPIMAQPRARMTEPMIVSPQSEPYQTIPSTSPREPYSQLDALPDQNDMAPIQDTPIDRLPGGDVVPNTAPRMTTPRTTTPRTTTPRMPVPDVNPNPPAEPKGGLFDNLDPFGDDGEVRLPKPYRSVQPSNFRLPKSQTSRSGVQLQAPQASSSRTPLHQNATQQRSVAMMRYGNSTHASGRQVAQSHQHSAHQQSTHRHTASQPVSHHSTKTKTVARYSSTRSSGTQRAATQRARQVSHQQSAQHKAAVQRASAQRASAHSNASLHRHPAPAQLNPMPKQRVVNGQRHSVPNYSAYGHTTNR